VIGTLLVAGAVASAGSASSAGPFDWSYPPFHPFEYGATAGLAAVGLWLETSTRVPVRAAWKGPILFDESVRSIRLRDQRAADVASVLSDVTAALPQLHAVVVDGLVVPGVVHGAWRTALEIEMINAETLAITMIVTRGLFRVLPRERPVVEDCRGGVSTSERCAAGTNASFPSGHTAFAFAGAGLVCVHHAHFPIYGGGAGDVAACVTGLGLATATGLLRILDDRHWASDTILGAGLGFATGYLLPELLHYRGDDRDPAAPAGGPDRAPRSRVRVGLAPLASADVIGAALQGRFL
jgi:membrane-associated phospholipid phosphatase